MPVKRDNPSSVALVLFGLVVGLTVGVALGLTLRRPARVICSSSLRIEPVGPGAWSLVCEGGR